MPGSLDELIRKTVREELHDLEVRHFDRSEVVKFFALRMVERQRKAIP